MHHKFHPLEDEGNSGLSYLLLVNHLPEVLIARMLIEPSSAAWQNIVFSWLHYIHYFWGITSLWSETCKIEM